MPVHISRSSLNQDPLKQSFATANRARRAKTRATVAHEAVATAIRNDIVPSLELVDIPIADLKLPDRSVRQWDETNVAETKNVIGQFGFTVPIIVGRDNEVIDGTVRVKAAKELGMTSVPCVRAGHLNPDEQKALHLAINRLGHSRPYDMDVLQQEFRKLAERNIPIRAIGFSSTEVDQILRREMPKPVKKTANEAGDVTDTTPVTRPGDLWLLDEHRLLAGDATQRTSYDRVLQGERPQLVLTDPPYAIDVSKIISTAHRDFVQGGGDMTPEAFSEFASAFLAHLHDVLVDGGIALSFMDWRQIARLITAGTGVGFELINLIVWSKSQAGMGSLWRSQHELVAAFKKPGKHKNNVELGRHGRDRSNVWQAAGAGTLGSSARELLKDHPTPKPVELLTEAIYDVTDRGDIVLDPFGGSGSTLIACSETGRLARLIELDPIYCDLIVRRWQEEVGGYAVHAETGERFSQVAGQRQAEMNEAGDDR